MTAALACGSCGTGLRENAKFCDECGAPTAGSADTANYKQVTVLFADVVHSMEIAAALDIERFRDIMTEVVERAATVARRFDGTVEHTGDGVMAIFGAPVALEDHAFRGCLAALAIQDDANRLAAEVQRRDGVALQLRVGLNSGRVIAGEIGSGSLGYTATGESVGLAQRMESVAPPGGVMLSESTAKLVTEHVTLAEPEWVHIKNVDEPVCGRQLLRIGPRDAAGRAEGSLVGRRWEMAALDAVMDRAITGSGGVVTVVGSAGLGKSRVAREAAALAASRGVEVFWTFCESHARDVPFHAVAQLLRAGCGVADLACDAARVQLRSVVPPDADPEDMQLLADLLGIADPKSPLPQIDPDARRRRLTALINTTSLTRTEPALFVIEDAHWIDAISESMLADFLSVIPRTPTMVLITARPEYDGELTRVRGAQAITLAPLSDSDTAALLTELLGSDASVGELAKIIADRAAGNPFFSEEMVRELVQRGVLQGERGNYLCRTNVAEVSVPATVQAAIGARLDRLSIAAKRTVNAASVIGARFSATLLAALCADPVVDELLGADLIDQVRFTPRAEYAFHHPLIRAVAYESQLKSARAESHRRLAAAIEEREPDSTDQNAALIAEHLQAAGELHAAHAWHMRAAGWSTNRDLDAARLSWERARRIADALPDDDPNRMSMCIAPRTMLCATDYRDRAVQESRGRFEELRTLCRAAGDKVSLAIGMTGLVTELLYAGRTGEGSRLASEQMALLESIGDPTLTMSSAMLAFLNWADAGQFGEILRWSQTVIDMAAGDPAKGASFGVGSPLAVALTWRGLAQWWLGSPGWRQDLDDAVSVARRSNHPASFAVVVAWAYSFAMHFGVLRDNDYMVRILEEAVQTAEEARDDVALLVAEYGLAGVLLSRDDEADRHRGLELMVAARDLSVHRQIGLQVLPVHELWLAREKARRGDRDAAIPVMRQTVNELHRAGRPYFAVWGTGAFVETLLERGSRADTAEAEREIDRLANLRTDDDSAIRDITLLRLRALLARVRGDDIAYRVLAIRYRTMAKSLGFEGHIDWAEAMIE